MIRNVVFDLGNVLVRFSTAQLIRCILGDAYGEDMAREIFHSAPWHAHERGQLDRAQTLAALCAARPDHAPQYRRVLAACDSHLLPTGNGRLVKALQDRGLGTYFLSNTNASAMEYMRAHMDFFSYMRGGICSYLEGEEKPGREIFCRFLTRYGHRPEECLFVDDRADNIETAAALGFCVCHLSAPEALEQELVCRGLL